MNFDHKMRRCDMKSDRVKYVYVEKKYLTLAILLLGDM